MGKESRRERLVAEAGRKSSSQHPREINERFEGDNRVERSRKMGWRQGQGVSAKPERARSLRDTEVRN